ncbi:hypothetical protein V8E51_005671 [Hyaloscypha variabilis]|uniref:Uncharacterized protein n=1 Tax=Hyaloscypha variabilis (strain UAMH 11265 / GT02V1 / F) TaxID=1149755 RepID=A0A2J6S3I7_HYAVF|nr:hypothetical protein L207DRAFT_629796 [Hyaloscypha variabilis F]
MIAILKVCILLFAFEVAAKPHPAQHDGPSTTVLTETTTLYATLIPPVLPAVTVSANRTQSIFTSTTTFVVNLNCTATAYSAIVAPPAVASAPAIVPSIAASIPGATPAPAPSSKVARQVSTALTPSSTLVVATTAASSADVVTAIFGTTITATTTLAQRPVVTRTIYSVILATQATPFTRTVQQCSATQEVMYTIETATVTTTFARTVWPSTTTVVTFVECTPRPAFSRVPPMGPSMAFSTGAVQSKRQVAVVSTTIHQTRLVYAATTVVMTQPYTRVVTSCSVSTPASTTAA